MPIIIKKIPMVFSITKKCFDKKLVTNTPFTRKKADITKGILKPAE